MRQKWALSLKYFIAPIAGPLIFNTLYIWVQRGFVFVNLLVQHHSIKTFGINMPNVNCTMQWPWGECVFSHVRFECHLALLRGKEQFLCFKSSVVVGRKSQRHFSTKLPLGPWVDTIGVTTVSSCPSGCVESLLLKVKHSEGTSGGLFRLLCPQPASTVVLARSQGPVVSIYWAPAMFQIRF